MEYEVPSVEIVGQASELIQASCGSRDDGDGYLFSYGCVITPLEEEKAE